MAIDQSHKIPFLVKLKQFKHNFTSHRRCNEQVIIIAINPCSVLSECPILPSSIAHGFVQGSGSLEGDRYQFICENGYSLIGDDTLVCMDTGVWNGSFSSCLIGK